MTTLDLNADLGELPGSGGRALDAALIDVVTSVNVACGAHTGDAAIMAATCAAAAAAGVRIGAHIGYRDAASFGRVELGWEPERIAAETTLQLAALTAAADAAGTVVSYVKPHGALYHRCVQDSAAAAALCGALPDGLAVVGPPGSFLLAVAAAGRLRVLREGFIDRGYRPDGTLIARGSPGAMLDPDAAVAQALGLAGGRPHAVDTLCVHGDGPDALALARRVRGALEALDILIAAP